MNHIRDHQCIQRGSEILQKLFVNKDTQDTRKEKQILWRYKKKQRNREHEEKQRRNTMEKYKMEWRGDELYIKQVMR